MSMTRLPGRLGLLLLVVAAALSWWLARRDADERVADAPVASTSPGYTLGDATLEQTDARGRLELRVHAAAAEQDSLAGDVRLAQLRVDYFPEDARAWLMTADRGLLPPGGRLVELSGDVQLTGRTAASTRPAVVHTERLELDVERSLALTQDPVRIELAPYTVTARGLRADLKRDTLRLESMVNGHFAR